MQIVIPMSGTGNRFIECGYQEPKPLIIVDGKPMIEHVVNLFPQETDFIFVCNSLHLQSTDMRNVLTKIAPECKIVEIPLHKKGPVYAVLQAQDFIKDDEEVIVNYCDFSTYWDYEDFLNHTRSRNADGAIPSYKGFHPHMLGKINYAFMRDEKQWMLEIREKQPFTDNRMNEYASNGTYYFKKGCYVKKYFKQLMDEGIDLNGEYYVSMVYNLLKKDGLNVSIYEIQHMLQWGTPKELEEYISWSSCFEEMVNNPLKNKKYEAIKLIPLAGKGERFKNEGYINPKPLIEVSSKPMIIQAAQSLPDCSENVFVCLQEHLEDFNLEHELINNYPNAKIIGLSNVTQGQACTCEIGLKDQNLDLPLFIGTCDNSMLYDAQKLNETISQSDVIAFSFRNNPSVMAKPQAYGWLVTDKENNISSVSVKKPISDNPIKDHAVVGAFYFKKARYFIEALKYLYDNNTRVNNEFYVDSCVDAAIRLGFKAKVFEVDKYICWGTPDDLKSFQAYQSLFHKLEWHSYSLDKDNNVDKSRIEALKKQYCDFKQEHF